MISGFELVYRLWAYLIHHYYRCGAWSWFAPNHWETSLQSNAISHWMDTNLHSALPLVINAREVQHNGIMFLVPIITATTGWCLYCNMQVVLWSVNHTIPLNTWFCPQYLHSLKYRGRVMFHDNQSHFYMYRVLHHGFSIKIYFSLLYFIFS